MTNSQSRKGWGVRQLGAALLFTAVAFAVAIPTADAQTTKPVKVKFATWVNDFGPMGTGINWYLKEVERRSGGRIQIERYWRGSLAPTTDILDAVSSGAADIGHISHSYYPGKLPLATLHDMGFFYTNDLWTVATAMNELYARNEAVQRETARHNVVYLTGLGASNFIIFSTKPVKSLDDMRGLRLRATGRGLALLLNGLGVVPVPIPAPETYSAIERGTVDGAAWTYSAMCELSIDRLIKSVYEIRGGSLTMYLAMRRQTWDRLSPDLQQVFREVSREFPETYHRIYEVEGDGGCKKRMMAAGTAIVTPRPEEVARVEAAAEKVVVSAMLREVEARGLPARQVHEALLGLIRQYEPQNPFRR